jgi:acetyltransferase
LLRRLVQVGREEGLKRITAEILPENLGMQAVCEKLKFRMKNSASEGLVRAELRLSAP